MNKTIGQTNVLCGYCKKPIHIDDFGGIQKGIGFFHSACHIKSEKQKMNHKSSTKIMNQEKDQDTHISTGSIPYYILSSLFS